MALPQPVDPPSPDRTEVVVDGSGSAAVLSTLSSETARDVLAALRADPKPLSAVVDAAGTSIRNARYHVERLCDVGVVEPIDEWCSRKGKEMTVYAVTTDRLVIRVEPGE